MPKFFQLFVFLGFIVFVKAQNKTNPNAQKARMDSTNAVFFKEGQLMSSSKSIIKSAHVDSLIIKYIKAKAVAQQADKGNQSDYVSMFNAVKLSDSDFNQLSAKEKFVYAFKYPEQYTQICSLYFFDGHNAPFLHASLPFIMEGNTMSVRQRKSLEASRNTSIVYLIEIIQKASLMDDDYKQAIVNLKAFECIPALMLKYQTGKIKDNYILTTGLLLMKNDSFPSFFNSNIYKILYKEQTFSRGKMDLTEAIRTTTIDLINKYYKWKTGK